MLAASVLRNIIKELKRAGVWEEWTGDNDGIVEEELWFPHEMLETNLDAHVVTGDEHFTTIARILLERKGIRLNDTERDFLMDMKFRRTEATEPQMEWIYRLAQKSGIDWKPPDKESSGPLSARSASRKW
jgi:hypothetical protein